MLLTIIMNILTILDHKLGGSDYYLLVVSRKDGKMKWFLYDIRMFHAAFLWMFLQ